ncbi:GNAT family acetyltransferase [Ornithinimicrobium sp. Arc0846-15]|nr:GNAT family acetyltransferase [Ornithinimicrobium laminariae]
MSQPTMHIRPFEVSDTEAVVQLWQATGLTRPWNDPHRDIERKLSVQPELFLVGEAQGRVIATAMTGYDGHRGWVYYLAVDPSRQGVGFGRHILSHAEGLLLELGCPKVNMQVRSGNDAQIERYRRWGYSPDGATGMGKRIIPD